MEVSESLSHYGSSVTSELKNVGERVGRFEIVDQLAVTLLGPLYRVRVNRGVGVRLLQVIPSGLGKDTQMRKQLVKRVEQLSKVESDLLLQPEEVVDFEDTIAIQYPDWSGRTLSTRRKAERAEDEEAMTSPEIKGLIQRTILSIESASVVKVHHYGITPDFILIEDSGAIKVWGFGVLQSVSRRKFEIFVSSAIVPLQRETSDGPNYTVLDALSPEWRNEEPADVRSDLFSLGVLSHNLLAGHIREVTGGEDASVDTEIHPGWALYLGRLLENDPAARYQTTIAVATDLERVEHLHLGPERVHKLDRVPLPKSVENRVNKEVGRYIRIGVLVIFGLCAVATAFLLYSVLEIDSGSASGPQIFAAGEKSPQVIFKISPAYAQVKFFGEGVASFITANGEVALVGKRREYIGIVQAPQHIAERIAITLTDELQTKEINLPLAWANLRLVAPSGSRLDIRQPSGENIFLDYVPEGDVLVVESRLFAETYTIVVSRPGHETVEFPDTVLGEGEWTELIAEPVPLPASLKVVSNPAGLPVRIDGSLLGKTPLILDDLLWPDPVKVVVGGGNLRTREKEVILFPGRENVLDFGNVEAAQGDLKLTVTLRGRAVDETVLAGLRIIVEDRIYQSIADLQISLLAGSHTVRVEHPDYLPRGGPISIVDETLKRLAVDLRPRPATVSVQLPEAASDYWVEWNGARKPLVDGQFQASAGEPLRIIVGSPDHYSVGKDFLLPANGSAKWDPALRSLPGPNIGESWTAPNLPLNMIWISSGTGRFGSPVREAHRRPNEDELTRASFSSGLWVASTEVTQATYEAIMGSNPSRYHGSQFPVDSVSWHAAIEFFRRLTEKENAFGRLPKGYVYRLPTEAEWEYAARAGSTTPFYFGKEADGKDSNFVGEYPRDYNQTVSNRGNVGSLAVASFAPNAWGLYDIAGNVSEWALDAYNERLPGVA
tara:strand:- start:115803 stop:118646 length:2844 start_codon:yes stop_codon:yes gene_type:complete